MHQEILQMLQQSPGTLHSAKEVGRRLDRDRFREDPNWARPLLKALVEQGHIQQDSSGYFFYPKDPRE